MTVFMNDINPSKDHFDAVGVLSQVLSQLIDINSTNSRPSSPNPALAPSLAKFQSSYPPTITIHAYLSRIQKYANLNPSVFTATLIYMDRLIEATNLSLSPLNIHRLLLVAVVVATKFLQDDYYKNCYYAKLGGITTAELNSLEITFLSLIQFNLYISSASYSKYTSELKNYTCVAVAETSPPCAAVQPIYRTPSPTTITAPSPYYYYYATSNPAPPVPNYAPSYYYPPSGYYVQPPPAPYYYYSAYPLVVGSSM